MTATDSIHAFQSHSAGLSRRDFAVPRAVAFMQRRSFGSGSAVADGKRRLSLAFAQDDGAF
jgi:hypothetical protein